MNILLFGATGMVGQGVLRECLLDRGVQTVQTIGRTPTRLANPKLKETVHQDLGYYETIQANLTGFDACFFCLGASSTGMPEPDYEKLTYGVTLAAAETLVRLNPQMTFIYVSGAGTDSSERGRIKWARVKGRTENALLRLPFHAALMFRPGIVQPLHGARSKTKSYRVMYAIVGPLLPLFRRVFPNQVLTTEQIGQAMLAAVQHGAPKPILEARDIRALAAQYQRVG